MSKSVRLSIYFFCLGLFLMFSLSFYWVLIRSDLKYSISFVLPVIALGVCGVIIIVALTHLFNHDKNDSLYFLPLLSAVFSIFFIIYCPFYIIRGYQNYFIDKNIELYEKAALLIQENLKNQRPYNITLPQEYRQLTQDGTADVIGEKDQYNIQFLLRSSIGSGEFVLYSPNGKTLIDSRYSKITKIKKPHWYYGLITD